MSKRGGMVNRKCDENIGVHTNTVTHIIYYYYLSVFIMYFFFNTFLSFIILYFV